MFEEEKEVKEISKWGCKLKGRLEEFIQGKEELETTVKKIRTAEEEKSNTEKTELEETKLRKRAAEELKSEKARVKMIAERKIREEEKKDAKPAVKVKLPKLEITKFKGNHLHWTCFWCQFKAEIYRSSLSPVAKFFHLKEFLELKA